MAVLITGSEGFMASELLKLMGNRYEIVGLDVTRRRNPLPPGIEYVQGSITSIEDLKKLDSYSLTSAVHLSAVLVNLSEESTLWTNFSGTRYLYRYLIDRGCTKFVTASSIALTGSIAPDFMPLEMPIPDDHPCLASDAYGFSKGMVEELSRFYHRQDPQLDFTNLRFGVVVDEDHWHVKKNMSREEIREERIFNYYTTIHNTDVARAILLALERDQSPGVRSYNIVNHTVSCERAVNELLDIKFGDRHKHLDLSHYRTPGHEHDSLFATEKSAKELGFSPWYDTRGFPFKKVP